MSNVIVGIVFVLFGLCIGGAGLATAGIGIGIPMIPLGIFLLIRGLYHVFFKLKKIEGSNRYWVKTFESTRIGKICLGTLMILFGIATSAFGIGLIIILLGVGFIVWGVWPKR